MAERRMFAKTIIDSDMFLDMPLSTQALYFHLSMRADDDGFLNNSNRIMRLIGANQNDFDLLLIKKFIIKFDDGICVIKHWRIHNYIQNDRYKETNYKKEKSTLNIDDNKAYTFEDTGKKLIGNRVIDVNYVQNSNTQCIQDVYKLDTDCIHDVSKVETQVRLGKDSIEKEIYKENGHVTSRDSHATEEERRNKIKEKNIKKEIDKVEVKTSTHSQKFIAPTLEEVIEYCNQRNNNVDAQTFIDFYESKGWMIGKNKMKNWKAAVRTWERKDQGTTVKKQSTFTAHI